MEVAAVKARTEFVMAGPEVEQRRAELPPVANVVVLLVGGPQMTASVHPTVDARPPPREAGEAHLLAGVADRWRHRSGLRVAPIVVVPPVVGAGDRDQVD